MRRRAEGQRQAVGGWVVVSNRWSVTARWPPAWARQRSSAQLPAGAEPGSFLQTKGPCITNPLIYNSDSTPTSHTGAATCDLCVLQHILANAWSYSSGWAEPSKALWFSVPNKRCAFICTVYNSKHCWGGACFWKTIPTFLGSLLEISDFKHTTSIIYAKK